MRTGAEALPDAALNASAPLGVAFAALGVTRLRTAARWVQALPYGRTTDRADWRLVLPERRGTCSTKHALLAALAAEAGASVGLVLGVYLMDEATTPGVGAALAAAGLCAVPEAHCVLDAERERLDLTWPGRTEAPSFVWEEAIRPDQIGAHKVSRHRDFVRTWAAKHGLDAAHVWAAREACIAALSRPA